MLSNLSQDLLQIRSYVYAEEPNIDIHNFIGTFTRVSGCVVTLNPNLPSDMLISSPTSESLSLLCSSCNRNRARLCSTHKSELSTVISVLLNTPQQKHAERKMLIEPYLCSQLLSYRTQFIGFIYKNCESDTFKLLNVLF